MDGYREPAAGVSRYGKYAAVCFPSRFCERFVPVMKPGRPVTGFELVRVRERFPAARRGVIRVVPRRIHSSLKPAGFRAFFIAEW